MKARILVFLISLAVNIGATQAADFTILSSSNKGGTIDPRGKILVTSGGTQAYTATAASEHYLADLKVDGVSVLVTDHTTTSYSFENVVAKHKIAAKFASNPAITAKSNKGGVVSPPGKTLVAYGADQSYTITPDVGFHLTNVTVDGVAQGAITTQDFTNVISKHSVTAKFAINTYTLSTNSGANGTITPASVTVKHGSGKTFTIKPANGYQIDSVSINGDLQTGIPASGQFKVELKSVTEDMVIAATFKIPKVVPVSGLAVGSQVSVVDVQQQTTQNVKAFNSGFKTALLQDAFTFASVPVDSDYNNDKTNVYVHEKAGEAFKTVNMVLCMIEQTQYSDSALVNQGFYKAMIDSGLCQGNDSADNSGSSAQAGTSATAAPSYDTWIANSERSSETSNHLLTGYVHMAKGGPQDQPMTVQAKLEVSEAASDTNPLGLFTMNYKGVLDTNPAITLMKGMIKTELTNGNVVIRFAEQEGPNASPMRVAKAAYTKDGATQSGHGSAYQLENFGNQPNETSINFAYDANFFKRVDVGSGKGPCLDRSKFETSAWRYGLYDAVTGSRANVNGGFPVNTQQDGKGIDGYLSYYGLNLPPNARALSDGDSIYKGQWDNGVHTSIPYTLFVKDGKLKRHTKSVITLDDIKNIPLEGNIPVPGNPGPGNTMYRVTWDGVSLAIVASAAMGQNGPPAWTDKSPATVIDNTYVLPFSNLGLYSQALGGQLNIQLQNCVPLDVNNPGAGFSCDTPTAAVPVVFYKENMVSPSDSVPATLTCYENCPTAASAAGMDATSQQTMTYSQEFNPAVDGHHDYTFADMMLTDSGTSFDVVLTTTPAGQPWGYNSGPLFDPSPANKAKLVCDWDPAMICGWKAWNALDEFYTWETGPNSWNKFTAVKDVDNNVVTLDPPWQAAFTYPVDGTNGVNSAEIDAKYAGTKFFLQYNGFGNLQGIPGKCVNPADPSQVVTDCSQPGFRWVPEFTIPTGSIVTVNASEYLVKALDIEQRMSKSSGSCTGLSPVDMSNQWPNLNNSWVNPNLPVEPVINEPPKVIGGVIQ